jgi:hypothetical protein
MASAAFTVNGSATPPEKAVSASSTVTLALVSTTGVRTVAWSFVGNSSSSLVNPTITPAGTPSGATATFPMPSGSGQGYRIQCVINNGVDDAGVAQSSYTKTAIVGVVDGTGTIPFCVGETYERDATYGYIQTLNARATGGGTPSIADDSVTFAKMQNIGVGLIGNDSGTADPKLITLGSSLAFAAGAIGVATAGVTLAMMANVATASFIGRTTAGTGVPEALTATQATALLNTFTSGLKGLAPASGGGTSNFLRADGTWAAPSAALTAPTNPTDDGKVAYASAGNLAYATNIKSNGTRLDFGTASTTGLLNFAAGSSAAAVTIAAGLRADAGASVSLIRWGVNEDNRLTFGETTNVATHAFRAATQVIAVIGATQSFTHTERGTTLVGAATTGTVIPILAVTDAAHTALTASTERTSVNFDLSQARQWATGALTTQRSVRIQAPTLAFVGSSTITTAATVAISGSPTAGTNATVTNGFALWLESGSLGFGSNAARTGLVRFASNTVMLAHRNAANSANATVFYSDGADNLIVGDYTNTAGLYYDVKTGGAHTIRVNNVTEFAFSASQLDCNGNNIVNVAQLTGTFYTNEIDDGNSSTADTIDWSTGPNHKSTLNGDCTYTFTAPAQHKHLQLRMIWSGAGRNPSWPAAVKWAGGAEPTWITTDGAVNIASFYYDGTNYWGTGVTGLA